MTDLREELARDIKVYLQAHREDIADGNANDLDAATQIFADLAELHIERRIAAARKEERERCAMVVEGGAFGPCAEDVQAGAAAALRALGDK